MKFKKLKLQFLQQVQVEQDAISRKEKEPFLLHMDIDDIRDFLLDTMAQIQVIIKDQLQKV